MPDDSWYVSVTDGSLEQGDLFFQVQLLIPQYSLSGSDEYEINAHTINSDIIILSQTCDIVQSKVDSILVCPHESFSVALTEMKDKMKQQGKSFNMNDFEKEVRSGKRHRYFWLDGIKDVHDDVSARLIDFNYVFLLSKDYAIQMAKSQGNHFRLRPPYREHFSHSFAHFISRVALP